MNEQDRQPPQFPQKLQSLDLASLRGMSGVGDVLDALVCAIDDPDCEAPALVPLEGDTRRTEVIDGDPDSLDP